MKPFAATSKPVATIIAVAMLAAGCATPNGSSEVGSVVNGSECNAAVTAGIGAALGVLIGDSAKGAAIGAGLGAIACMVVNYQAEQVKSAKQVQDDYKTANKGQLPEKSTLVKYDTQVNPKAIRPGQQAKTVSYIEIIQGRNDAAPKLEEEMSLYHPDGKLLKTVRKPVAGTSGSGAFQGGFTIPMPQGVPQGVYPVKTALYLNGEKVNAREGRLQIVRAQEEGAATLALAR
ncbi:hypothetical protein SAMN06265795_10832 [Noviherbaspirillum humi]|uniref:Glycine zipper n=1 Tax=Noviherbaspirillum humi TaxID=1688639 RepID=A0A239HZN6_9BURK|nr:hypothetical protein [Noviherbaspirillum humi]SNS86731.1 hypothetical protein SAMN06265795_10832 [Noviherbaspirillum humi]